MDNSHLKFQLKDEKFAISVAMVLKILEFQDLTPVPKAPPFLIGVLNWQGSLLPVIDLNLKLGFTKTEIKQETCILVLELELDGEKTVIGCLVDRVLSVCSIDPDKVVTSPSIGSKYQSDIILGIYPEEDSFILLLDYSQIFDNDDLIPLSQNELNKNVLPTSDK